MAKEEWAGAVDSVGGRILANACAGIRYRGTVAACGLAGGMDFPATIAPFILRGMSLVGIDSVMCPYDERMEAWQRLAQLIDVAKLRQLTRTVGLRETISAAKLLLEGKMRGRVVVDVNRD